MEEIHYFDEHVLLTYVLYVMFPFIFPFIILVMSYLGFDFGVLILIFHVFIYALKECYM